MKNIILSIATILISFNSFSQIQAVPLREYIMGNDISLFEGKLTPSGKLIYDEIISSYIGDISDYQIIDTVICYDIIISMEVEEFSFVSIKKYGSSISKNERLINYKGTDEKKNNPHL